MKRKCKSDSAASILMGRSKHADGGEAMGAPMSEVGARRVAPNMSQRFNKGGRASGGAMQMEDQLKAVGTYSGKGSEMNKEDRKRSGGGGMKRKRHASGGDIGTNTGSSIAAKPGSDAIGYKKGGKAMKRAMGGVGKTRKDYPNT